MITVKFYGDLKKQVKTGHKGGIRIHANTMAEVRTALEQYLPFSTLLNKYPCEVRIGNTLKSAKTIPANWAAELLAKGEIDQDFTIHFVPGTGSGDEVTTAMVVTALVSAAISVGVTLLMNLLFPPEESGDDDRKSALYNSGNTVQKEGVALSYIAGEKVFCGLNVIEADVDVIETGGLGTRFQAGPAAGQTGSSLGGGGFFGNMDWEAIRNIQDILSGDKGGGNTIKNNSFSEATIKILGSLGRGEIGGIYGNNPTEQGQNVFFNELAYLSSNGEPNYEGVQIESRNGVAGQTPITLTPGVATNQDQSIELKNKTLGGDALDYPFVVTSPDAGYIKLRFNLVLVKTDKKGNQENTSVALAVDTRRSGGTWSNYGTWTFTGKSTSAFQRQVRVDAPALSTDPQNKWEFRIRRITADSSDDKLTNQTNFNGWVEVIERELSYDGSDGGEPTALFGTTIDLAQFDQNNKPDIAVIVRGSKIRVPSNYVNGHYPNNGSVWDGTWSYQITSNPVWHWFNIASTEAGRVGVGMADRYFNKFNLDACARYCDQFISFSVNGVSGTRRRHTLNKQFTDSGKAWEMLRTIAQSFRAVPYWDGASVVLIQDRPKAASLEASINLWINNSQVVEGQFVVTPTAAANRINRVEVEWDNPKDFYRKAVTAYQDDADIQINKNLDYTEQGVIKQRIYKVGCDNEAEAYQFARELVINSLYEDETITFTMPMSAAAVNIGDIVAVDDWHVSGKRPVGRVIGYTGGKMVLDTPYASTNGTAYYVHYTRADGSLDRRSITASGTQIISITVPDVKVDTPVMIYQQTAGVQPTIWRVIGIQEKSPGEFEVQGQKYVFDKYALVDQNIPIPVTEWTERNKEVPTPTSFSAKSLSYQDDITGSHRDIEISWRGSSNPNDQIQGYVLEGLAPGQGTWVELYKGSSTTFVLRDVQVGTYLFTVKAINTLGRSSTPASLQFRFGQDSDTSGRYPPVFVRFND